MKYYCDVCGNEIAFENLYRPRIYCSLNCRNYTKYKNALEKVLNTLEPTKKASKLLRGDMFRLSNLISNGTATGDKDLK